MAETHFQVNFFYKEDGLLNLLCYSLSFNFPVPPFL